MENGQTSQKKKKTIRIEENNWLLICAQRSIIQISCRTCTPSILLNWMATKPKNLIRTINFVAGREKIAAKLMTSSGLCRSHYTRPGENIQHTVTTLVYLSMYSKVWCMHGMFQQFNGKHLPSFEHLCRICIRDIYTPEKKNTSISHSG